MNFRFAVALSGGVDSLVAAFLLKGQGVPVVGIHFLTGFEPAGRSTSVESYLAEQLHIDVVTVDIQQEFRRHVIDYFVQTYRDGKTPNPCLVCNPVIKFGVLWEAARKLGAQWLATGHYARIRRDDTGRCHLLAGVDRQKDQSYFLSRMTPKNLEHAEFPLGGMTKAQVVEIARANGLIPYGTDESQDVCFVRGMGYEEFLRKEGGLVPEPGPIEDVNGRVLGRHSGLHRFTVGQRRGINCPAAQPYYVIRLEPLFRRLIVGRKEDLVAGECRVTDINWIEDAPAGPVEIDVRLRYRHSAVPAILTPEHGGRHAHLRFLHPQSAVTPGQGAVWYVGETLWGGGFIETGQVSCTT